MRLDDNLPEDKYFIEKSIEDVIKFYGGELDDWLATVGEKEVDENGRYSFKQEFIKINSSNFEYVSIGWYQTEKKDDFYRTISLEVIPFKSIFSILWWGLKNIKLVSNSVNRKSIDLRFENANQCFLMAFKYQKYYEIEQDANQFGKADEIKKFKELLDDGAITEDEFNEFKKKLLH